MYLFWCFHMMWIIQYLVLNIECIFRTHEGNPKIIYYFSSLTFALEAITLDRFGVTGLFGRFILKLSKISIQIANCELCLVIITLFEGNNQTASHSIILHLHIEPAQSQDVITDLNLVTKFYIFLI